MELGIYDQGNRGACGNYAYALACNRLGINVDINKVISINGLTHERVSKIFIENGYIKGTVSLSNSKLVDIWLKKGHYIVMSTSRGDFAKAGTPPYVMGQNGPYRHFFCIIEDCGDKWKCQNSWGDKWGDKGCFYVMKDEFKMFFTPRRLVV